MGRQGLLSQLCAAWFHSLLSLNLLPSSWCRSDTRPASVVAILGWHVHIGGGQSTALLIYHLLRCFSVSSPHPEAWPSGRAAHLLWHNSHSCSCSCPPPQRLAPCPPHSLKAPQGCWRNRSRGHDFPASSRHVCVSSPPHT